MKHLKVQVIFQLLVLVISLIASAKSRRCEFIFDDPTHFNSSSLLKSCYIQGRCPENIFYLLKNLQSMYQDVDFSDAQVLYIYSRWTGNIKYDFGMTKFRSMTSKKGHGQTWIFHVVLEKNGLIYDFEYNNAGRAVPIKDYFEKMFGAVWTTHEGQKSYKETKNQFFSDEFDDRNPPQGSQLRLHVRSISAGVYLNEYSFETSLRYRDGVKNYVYWILGDPRFDDQTLESYL